MTPAKANKRKMRQDFMLINGDLKFTRNLKNQELLLATKFVYQIIKDKYLIKVILLNVQKRFLW